MSVVIPSLFLLSMSAGPEARVAIVMDETLDQKARPSSDVAASLIEELSDSNLVFMEASRAEAVRQAARGKALSTVDVATLVDTIDADILILGEAELAQADAGLLKGLVTVESSARLRVVAVDSAEVIGTVRARSVGSHYALQSAASRSAEALAKKLKPKLTKVMHRPARYELDIALAAPMNGASTDKLVTCIESIDVIQAAQVLRAGPKGIKLSLQAKVTTRAVARRFSETDVGCGVQVFGYSARSLEGRFEPTFRVPVVASQFVQQGKKLSRDRWLRKELPRAFLAELAGQAYLDVKLDAPLGLPIPPDGLKMQGTFARRGEAMRVSVELIQANGKAVLRQTKTCPKQERALCFATAAKKFASELLAALQKKTEVKISRPASDTSIRIIDVRIKSIEPVHLSAFEVGRSAGEVVVENRSDARLEDVVLEVSLDGLSARPGRTELLRIEPRSKATLPVTLGLDPKALALQNDNRTVTARISVEADRGKMRLRVERTTGVLVFDKHAMRWSDPNTVAGFVTPTHPVVQAVVASARSALPQTTDPLAEPLALAEALASVRYGKDAVNPFAQDELDYVRFPSETVREGSGDCDDLAVLYSAALEAAGIRSLLVLTPGHLLAAAEVDVPPSAAAHLSATPNATFLHEGRVWIPVETTALQQGFAAAWKIGAQEMAKTKVTLVNVRKAWRKVPPTDLSAGAGQGQPKVPAELETQVRAGLTALLEKRQLRLASLSAELRNAQDIQSMHRAAILLGQYGKLDEARNGLETVLSKSDSEMRQAAAKNNLGNIDLLDGNAAQSERRYMQAFELLQTRSGGPSLAVPILLNAVVAAYVQMPTDEGAQARLTDYIDRALALDADRVSRFLERLPSSGAQVGSSASIAGLQALLLENPQLSSARIEKTASKASEPELAVVLHWVKP